MAGAGIIDCMNGPSESPAGAPADAALILQEAQWAERNGLPDRALGDYRKALAVSPALADAHHGVARILLSLNQPAESLDSARRALEHGGNVGAISAIVGQAHLRLGQIREAVPALRQALEQAPGHHALRGQLAEALVQLGLGDQAVAVFLAVEHRFANDVGFLAAMGAACRRAGAAVLAERVYLRLLELAPQREATYDDLAQLYMDHTQYSKARDIAEKALQLNPNQPALWNTLGLAQTSLGMVREAIASYRRVLAIAPNMATSHSNLLLTMHYITDFGPAELAEEHRRWGRLHAPAALATRAFRNAPQPGRRLRIGYLSADFRRHSVAFFFESLLDHHRRADFEVFCYGEVRSPDDVTARIRQKADQYRSIVGMHDRQVADLIRTDAIDVLVDLGGHTGASRIAVLGYKPAPVQATYCGYPDTTGIEAVDYRITDGLADPPGVEDGYTETLCRLPGAFLCYRPPQPLPALRPAPSQSGKPVTFGSFNREFKVSDATYDLWCRILRDLPDSSIVIKSIAGSDPGIRQRQLREFERRGVTAERVQLLGFIADQLGHLESYRNVDIALDTYPYHGTTTTLDALVMGVPVVTLAGYNHASRVGVTLLTQMGLEEFIAKTPDDYVAIAVGLGSRPLRITELHDTLRERLLMSALCDGPGFMRGYEYALRGMWSNWCRAQGVALTADQRTMAAFDFGPLHDGH
jgi:predicted O-linked N-acetylglucosamine transferase (SPINDLY family)